MSVLVQKLIFAAILLAGIALNLFGLAYLDLGSYPALLVGMILLYLAMILSVTFGAVVRPAQGGIR